MEATPFGRCRLIELLGRGGMGEVWRAHDTETKRIVAIKVLPAHLADDNEFVQRFRREAEAAAQLNSPHVVPIHTYGEIDGRLYVDMRLIEGRDLQTVLAEGALEPARAVRIIEGVALALHAAHQVGLMHRDVKPSNILLDGNDFAYLIDFGIARAADGTRMTKTGSTIGTLAYIAPERLEGEGVEDARVDIYSLACVLYECLTGEPPFAADTMPRLMMAHLHTPPPRPSITRLDVPARLDEVIATGMAKKPEQRYATTIELADAARDAMTVPIERPTPSPTRHRAAEPAPGPTLLDDATRPATPQAPPGRPPVPPPRPANRPPVLPLQPAERPPVRQPRPADRPPPATGTPPRQPWWRRTAIVIPAALVTVAVIVATIVITSQQHKTSNNPQSALPTSTQHREPAYGPQVTLPFTGLKHPNGVAVDAAGDLYVTDPGNNRVLKLAAGAATPSVLPFTGLNVPEGVAVDTAGTVYVVDRNNNRVLKLAAGAATPSVLPFTGLNDPEGVAVDTAGTVYVVDRNNNRVLKLAAGAATPSVLPFTGLNDPEGVAVDTAGTVYVVDHSNNRVLKLAAGSSTQAVLPFTGLNDPVGVAVDTSGNLYVVDWPNNRVLKLAAGSSTQAVLPFTGLNFPFSVAADSAGDLYVTDPENNRVLKLAAGAATQSVLPFTGIVPVGVAVDAAGNLYVTDNGNNRVLKLPAG